MKSQHTNGNWYEGNTGNHQGLVIDQDTGENIAVTYDKKHARLIASAPELLQALRDVMSDPYFAKSATRYTHAHAAIANATGKD